MEAPRSPVTTVSPRSATTPVLAAAPAIAPAPVSAIAFGSPMTTASEGFGSKFSGVEVSNRRLRAENQTPLAGVLEDGSSAKLMGPGYVVHSTLRHQGATQNSFSPLLGLGSEEDFCFGERERTP